MAACPMMSKAEVESLELSDNHVTNRTNSTLDVQRRAFAEKLASVRVAKVRARCGRRFRSGFEKLEELTEREVEARRHALAQKLIAKTLKQADRRRRPRRRRLKIYPLYYYSRRWTASALSPLMDCLRWLRQPWLRMVRIMASMAARKHYTSRVTCLPPDDHLVPLLSVSELDC